MNALKWSLVILAVMSFGMTGCSRKPKESNGEEVAEADTANIDASATPEVLPTVEQGNLAPQSDEPTMPSEQAPVAQASQPAEPTEPTQNSTDQLTQNVMPTPAVMPTPVPSSGESGTYTVQRGDTLMKVAYNVYGDILRWRSIYEMNKDSIKDANAIVPGTTLQYDKPAVEPSLEKNGDAYMIKKGDTLGSIADDVYGTKSKWKALWENNRTLIRDPNKIYAGFYLYYQMTEAEKSEAERLKASHTQRLGSTEQAEPQQAAPSEQPVTTSSAAPMNSAASGIANTPGASNNNGKAAGGLSNLMAPSRRTPASK